MSVERKAKIYNGITIFCVVLCMLLIGRVACDELFGAQGLPGHIPPAVTDNTGEEQRAPVDGYMIECRAIEGQINAYLPDDFPLKEITIEIEESGRIALGARASKGKIRDYLELAGIKMEGGGLIFKLLPGKIDVRLEGVCSCDSETGMVAFSAETVRAGDMELDISRAAEGCFAEFSKGLNKLLLASGVSFESIEFGDGYILLK